jgi:hypothetical protein
MGIGEAPQKSLSELQREAAELDIKLKQLELEQKERESKEKSGFLYRSIRNPVIITALITVGIPALVALATAINAYISTSQQRAADDIRYRQETNKSILLGVINSSDPYSIAGKLKIFLDTKLISDDSDSSFHRAEQTLEGQPLRDILSNILRASDNQPLQFSSALSQDFYPRFRRPIELRDLSYFIRLGYPRELLFRLFTDYVSFTPRDDPQRRGSFILYNVAHSRCIVLRPTASESKSVQPEFCFEDFIGFSELSGLSLEIKRASISNSEVGATGSAPEARLCFNIALANFARTEYAHVHADDPEMTRFLKSISLAEYHPICGETVALDSWLDAGTKRPGGASGLQALSVKANELTGRLFWDISSLANATVEFGTRSTGAVYNFLGQLMLHQDGVSNQLIGVSEGTEDPRILTIIKGQSLGCFVSVSYGGGVYCVPAVGAANTKRIFALLAQLPPE